MVCRSEKNLARFKSFLVQNQVQIKEFKSEIYKTGSFSILDPDDPYYYCITPGVYEVQLLISGLNQQEDISSITVIALGSGSVLNDIGDINGDGSVSLLDILICSNSILGFSDLGPEEFISSDLDYNGIIDLYDILSIIELIN